MKLAEAKRYIKREDIKGYRISFESPRAGYLKSDYFPEQGEELIETEDEAWQLAHDFAGAMWGKVINVYVIDAIFRPVEGYKERILNKYP